MIEKANTTTWNSEWVDNSDKVDAQYRLVCDDKGIERPLE